MTAQASERQFLKTSFGNFLMFIAVAIVLLYIADGGSGGNSLISVTVVEKDNSRYNNDMIRSNNYPTTGGGEAATAGASDAQDDYGTSSNTEPEQPSIPAAPQAAQKRQKKVGRKEGAAARAAAAAAQNDQQKQEPSTPVTPDPPAISDTPAAPVTPATPAANTTPQKGKRGRDRGGGGKAAAPAGGGAGSSVSPDDLFDPANLHISTLPKYTREQLLDRRDLYASIHVPTDYKGENLATIAGMQKLLAPARQAYQQFLRRQDQYGDYADKIFKPGIGARCLAGAHVYADQNRLKTLLTEGHHKLGAKHFVDKMKLKVVQTQLKFLQAKNPSKTLTKFVHLHGGHSAAAAHGNLFEESYTAVAEKMLRPILRRIGINYVGRNMAAGGTGSADEVSMCSNSYFGYEGDLFTFDYGMIDGKVYWKQQAYIQRGALRSQLPPLSEDINDIPSRPAFLAMNANRHTTFTYALQGKRNMTVMNFNDDVLYNALFAVPDMSRITVQSEIDAMPDMVRNFKCNGKYEKGPVCAEKKVKYSMKYPGCADRPHKASWHPGFKLHGVQGHLIAMGILDHLEDAMKQLAELEPPNESKADAEKRLTTLFWELNNAEQARYDHYVNNWESANGDASWVQGKNSQVKDYITQKELMTLPNFCHTAKLPADQRYRGFVNENFEKTTINVGLEKTYDNGFFSSSIEQEKEGTLTMTYDKPHQNEVVLLSNKQWSDPACPVLTTVDSRDNFFISSRHGARTMEIPNDTEAQFYSDFVPKQAKGYIMVCFGACSWGKCDPADVRPMNKAREASAGKLEMTVNGELVTDFLEDAGGGCYFMAHAYQGGEENAWQRLIWKPSKRGKWSIRMRVTDSTTYGMTKISSFIIW